jgi:succinate dehydrogenase/fumarate reductase flavoprotein subunit
MQTETIKSDILCIGGGPAGLMAAIRASELGADVILAEKGNTIHSGSGSAGNDHFECYIPEFHGQDMEPILDAYQKHPLPGRRADFSRTLLERSYDMVKLWDGWGIPMKYKDKWDFAGHALPGHIRIHLKYTGGKQKKVMTEQALKRGVKIRNRVTVFELLRDKERVIGALGYDTWNQNLIEFQAKAVFLGTGGCTRLFPSSTPGLMFNLPACPYTTGDGRAMVYRAGGDLFDMQDTGQWAGIKYFARSGKATWIGVLRTSDDKPIGPFITKPDIVHGDSTADCWPTVFDDYMKSGKGPVYMDCRGAPEEDIDYMKHWLRNEGNQGVLDYMKEEGIDPSTHAVEFRTYEIGTNGGVFYNPKGETTLKGLFASGQEYSGGMSFAVTFGWITGETMSNYIKAVDFSENLKDARGRSDDFVQSLESILERKEGSSWEEANLALQQIMWDYAGLVRSETLLEQGLKNMRRLKVKSINTLTAGNGHELGRCIEALNLMDVGEALMLTARERKETRGKHNRTDYPFTNPLMDKFLFLRQEDGEPVFTWKEKK